MYLKRLELQGFKSFPEKIKLEFHKGITAVVGPNGSGKSNVSDAVRWVLGEQSAKSLRGAKMEDVIFSGTENRRPLSFAEVSMVIDNQDQMLSLPFTEITVTRKVYRSGESEYLINGTTCRLKDIHELFMDTGIGKEGYSIIGQGRIDEILSTRGEDRRLLFEEAAGIVKYKNRRREAYDSLEKEKQNLVRVQDIIRELYGQMDPLLRQSETAKQYLSLKERLKLLQVNLFLIQADRVKEILDDIEDKLEDVDLQIEGENRNQEALRQAYENLRGEAEATEDMIKTIGEQAVEIRSSMEQRENDIKLSEEQIQHINRDILRLEKEIEKKEEAQAIKQEEKNGTESQYSEQSLLFQAKKEALEELELEFADINSKMSEAQQQVEQYNANIFTGLQQAADLKNEIQKRESAYERTGERKEQLDAEARHNTEGLDERTAKIQALEKQSDSLSKETQSLEAGLFQMETECEQLTRAYKEKQSALGIVSKALHEAASRRKLLAELSGDYEGYYKSVKVILKRKRDGGEPFAGIHGAVGEIITVPKAYETAITIAVGGNVQSIVVGNEKDAQHAIEYLKKNNEGRVTFLPLSAASSRGSVAGEALREPGVLGIAKDLIEYDKLYEPVMESLLGRILVVDTLERGIAIYKKYRYSLRIVTLEGDLLSPGGAMTGGSSQKSSIFTRRRELQELTESVATLQIQEKSMNTDVERLERQLVVTEKAAVGNKERIARCRMEIEANLQGLEQAKAETKVLLEKQAAYRTEDTRLMEQLQVINKEIRELALELAAVERKISLGRDALEQFQRSMAEEQSFKDEKMLALTDLKVELGSLEQILKASSESIKRIERDIAEGKSEIEACRDEIAQNRNETAKKSQDIEDFCGQLKLLKEKFSATQSRLTTLNETKKQLSLQLVEKEKEEKEEMSLIADLQKERLRHTMRKEQLEQDTRRIYDQMWDEYKLTYLGASEYPRLPGSLDKMQKEERQVKNEIESLGSVNVGAIEEYKTVSSRHEFLTKQADDIIKAEDKLRDLIMELSEQMEAQFRDQFKRISENFGIVFQEMFGGGQAYLRLADESRALESDIDIIAQPPGKNLQSMTLLSGGERALTATALLFGILRLKPSPFCILDEVESALDDANVTRYANLLKHFNDTQFILITHRKGTMEVADVLYGITMQEQGISKLVSVKLTE